MLAWVAARGKNPAALQATLKSKTPLLAAGFQTVDKALYL